MSTPPQPGQPSYTPGPPSMPQAQPAPAYQTQPAPLQPAPIVQAPAHSTLPTTLAYTNTFALVSVILAFIAPIAGIVFGHLALGQIKRNGDTGRGLALTGLILGYIYVGMIALIFFLYVGMIVLMFGAIGAAISEVGNYGYSS